MEDISKDPKNLEMKTTRSEMKNTLHGINILDIAKVKMIKCEDGNSNYTY